MLRYEFGLLCKTTVQAFTGVASSHSSSSSRMSVHQKKYANLGKHQKLLMNMFYEQQISDFNVQSNNIMIRAVAREA